MREEIILAYVPSLNRFIDKNDMVVHDIHCLLDHWQIQKWFNDGYRDTILDAKDGTRILLVCITSEEEDDLFDFLGFQESFGLKTDRVYY
jgi:hypothetical protein